jgi:hypothetical protein
MTNPPFHSEVRRLRSWGGGPINPDAVEVADQRHAIEVNAVVAQLGPIRSRAGLIASFAREASPSEPVRTAYAIRWLELGPGIAATGRARSRGRRVMRPLLRGRA